MCVFYSVPKMDSGLKWVNEQLHTYGILEIDLNTILTATSTLDKGERWKTTGQLMQRPGWCLGLQCIGRRKKKKKKEVGQHHYGKCLVEL